MVGSHTVYMGQVMMYNPEYEGKFDPAYHSLPNIGDFTQNIMLPFPYLIS